MNITEGLARIGTDFLPNPGRMLQWFPDPIYSEHMQDSLHAWCSQKMAEYIIHKVKTIFGIVHSNRGCSNNFDQAVSLLRPVIWQTAF